MVEEVHRAVRALPWGEGSGGIPGGRRDRRRLLAEIRQHLMRPAHHGAISFFSCAPRLSGISRRSVPRLCAYAPPWRASSVLHRSPNP